MRATMTRRSISPAIWIEKWEETVVQIRWGQSAQCKAQEGGGCEGIAKEQVCQAQVKQLVEKAAQSIRISNKAATENRDEPHQ